MSIFQNLFGRRPTSRATPSARNSRQAHTLLRNQIKVLVLSNVEDIFDADSLWSRQHGGRSGIVRRDTNRGNYRLHNHLKAYKRQVQRQEQDKGQRRLIGYKRVFTDVIVQIAEPLWRDEHRSGEPRFALLTENLAERHRNDFRRDLKGAGRQPRYVVTPAADLKADEVRFLFGSGVFVPGEDDTRDGELKLFSGNGDPLPLPPWEFYDHEGRVSYRPPTLYTGQRTCYITGPRVDPHIPLTAPVWPDAVQGYVQLSRPPAARHWRAYGDGEFLDCPNEEGEPFNDGRLYRFTTPADGELCLQVEPQGAPIGAAEPEEDWPDAPDSLVGRTIVGPLLTNGAVDLNAPRYVLLLEGMALPRIDGRWQVRDRSGRSLQSWRLWLNGNGQPADLSVADPQTLAWLEGSADGRTLKARHVDRDPPEPVAEFPFRLRTDPDDPQAGVTVEGPPLEGYLGRVCLEDPADYALALTGPLHKGPLPWQWLGRGGDQPSPDLLPLDLLSQSGSLRWSSSGDDDTTLGQMQLSRRHLQVRVNPAREELELCPPKGGTRVPSFLLSEDLKPLKTLYPGKGLGRLKRGQHLLLGCYLLRFGLIND